MRKWKKLSNNLRKINIFKIIRIIIQSYLKHLYHSTYRFDIYILILHIKTGTLIFKSNSLTRFFFKKQNSPFHFCGK